GALLAALTLAAFSSPRGRRPFLAVSVGAAAAGVCGLALWGDMAWVTAGWALTGVGLGLFNATRPSAVQRSTDGHNRGRVMGIWSIIICGALPLGNQLAGYAADRWGVAPVLAAQGLACLASAAGGLALGAVWNRGRARGQGHVWRGRWRAGGVKGIGAARQPPARHSWRRPALLQPGERRPGLLREPRPGRPFRQRGQQRPHVLGSGQLQRLQGAQQAHALRGRLP